VPTIIRFPGKWKHLAPSAPGTACDRLISFVDYGPTVLSLAGVKAPDHMQGSPFLGGAAEKPRAYIHGFRDRMDDRYDLLRSVRDRRWNYIRNYRPDLPWAQYISYMYEMPTMKAWQRLHDEGKLNDVQDRFFRTKPVEELYDTEADPWEIRNLADDPAQRGTLDRMRAELRRWMIEIRDLGFLPEAELRTRFGSTPAHEAVRKDPKSYPLERLIDAAERATRGDLKCVDLLDDPDSAVRYWGAIGCRVLGEKAAPAEDRLVKALGDGSPSVRIAAADALSHRGRIDEALPVLARGLKDENEWVRLHAATVLDALGAKADPVRDALKAAAGDKNDYIRRVLEHALGK
jgi:hypothetical protein